MSTSQSNNDQSSLDAVLQLLSSLTLSHDEAQSLIQVIANGSGPSYSSSSNNSALDSPTSTVLSTASTTDGNGVPPSPSSFNSTVLDSPASTISTIASSIPVAAFDNGVPSSPSSFNSTVLDSPASTVSTIASSTPAAAAEVAPPAASTTATATPPTVSTTAMVTSPAAVTLVTTSPAIHTQAAAVPAVPQATPADPIAPQPAVVHNHPAPADDDFAYFPHLPMTTVIINGEVRTQQHYCGFSFDVPHTGVLGPFYLVTRGRRVGIFQTWQRTSPHVIGVSCSTYSRVKSRQDGLNRMLDAIDLGEAQWLP
ncbi:hypothetical protein AZE42_10035 [Rhizopogon vesiculosus]|uniref:Ribonuclease H1 N-terminal domain-containing protein n=1 Tax=Rhizopogon vesiculosus TaxID=180088 RepID=A0A1J8R6G0_9AGAM|nr:hypothetical protein AZE42_10035 [Rhizopogon vesiculosus]